MIKQMLIASIMFVGMTGFGQCEALSLEITNNSTVEEIDAISEELKSIDARLQIDKLTFTDDEKIDVFSLVVYFENGSRLGWSSVGIKNSSFQDQTVLKIIQRENCTHCIGACD